MRWILAGLLALHGLIHLIGFAKAFELAELPQLSQGISKGLGVIWLVAALSLVAAALLLGMNHRSWWIVGLGAGILSQLVIVSAWGDAKFGTLANVLLLAYVLYGFASQGPLSFQAEYLRSVRHRQVRSVTTLQVTERDLEPLPQPIRCYLRKVGVVGQPRVHHFRVRWRGRIRGGPEDPWMEFTAEQYNFIDEPARFFLMQARRGGLPVDVFHAFHGGAATMRVTLLSLFSMVDASGPELTRAETVTLFNDMCLLAPGSLIGAGIRWEPIDERSVRAYYTQGTNTVSAVLSFNEDCELVDFVSDDRLAASSDGSKFVKMRWSTPVGSYRHFGPYRVFSKGRGLWHPPKGEYAYLEAQVLDLQVNGATP